MAGLQPMDVGQKCIEHFKDGDPRMHVYHIYGAWVGYFGDVGRKVPTNRDGGSVDPQFVRQMVEGDESMGMGPGMGIIMSGTDHNLGLNPGNFLDPMQLMNGRGKNPLEMFKDMSEAYIAGKEYGKRLRSENPPDGSVNPKDLDISMLDLLDNRGTDSPH